MEDWTHFLPGRIFFHLVQAPGTVELVNYISAKVLEQEGELAHQLCVRRPRVSLSCDTAVEKSIADLDPSTSFAEAFPDPLRSKPFSEPEQAFP